MKYNGIEIYTPNNIGEIRMDIEEQLKLLLEIAGRGTMIPRWIYDIDESRFYIEPDIDIVRISCHYSNDELMYEYEVRRTENGVFLNFYNETEYGVKWIRVHGKLIYVHEYDDETEEVVEEYDGIHEDEEDMLNNIHGVLASIFNRCKLQRYVPINGGLEHRWEDREQEWEDFKKEVLA